MAGGRGVETGSVPMERLDHYAGARDHTRPGDRLAAVRRASAALREELLDDSPVLYYRSFDLICVPYPTRYGFLNAFRRPSPYMHLVNRVFVVQFRDPAGVVRTLLVSPSDWKANRETPFFKSLTHGMGPFRRLTERLLAPEHATVEECLATAGIAPEAVDYISYDHLHTQDLRRWLGVGGAAGVFPNACLLVMRQEWESCFGLLPPQEQWYCPGGVEGIDPARVVLLDHDVRLGEGVSILRTPGHTEGNQSFAVRTPEGIMVTSENGVGPDAYAPLKSRVPGLRRYARISGMELVLNGNTLERGIDQYISMMGERDLAGPSARNPDFYNVVTSSEFRGYWAFPGLRPTFCFGPLEFGEPQAHG